MHRSNGVGKDWTPAENEIGVWDWDLSAGKVDWSPRLAKLCGVSAGTFSGSYRSLLRCVHPDDRRALANSLDEAWRRCDGFEQEFRAAGSDGAARWLFATGKFICGEQPMPSRMIGTVVDVTLRRRLEDEARVRQAEIAHLARLGAVGQMAAGMAHELTQPLTAILNFGNDALAQLQAGANETAADDVREMVREAGRASELLARMRTFGRKGQPAHAPMDINRAVREAVELLRYRLRHHDVRAEFHLHRGLPPVTADPVEIQQVLVNLIQNAIDAMRDNHESGRRLAVRTMPAEGGMVLVQIADTGEAVAPEQLEELFRPFFTTKSEGLGLGLSISRSIVEQHGGRIQARRNPEGGMTFEFLLPTSANGARRER